MLVSAQELRDYERKVTEFTLSNGLHFILLERHQVPVVSFHTYVNAGAVEDPSGKTGLASLIARLAFDGTESIGTRNWPAEKKALEDVETAFDHWDDERSKGSATPGEFAVVQAAEAAALSAAFQQQNPDEYLRAIQENGGVAIDSRATSDSIEVSYSLPSNRMELWFMLESQHMLHPVLRDFYRERQKLLRDSAASFDPKSPARVRQALLSTAFEQLSYRNPVLGWPNDVSDLRTADAKAYLDRYCVPANTVIAIVGDVDPSGARAFAEKYFGPVPARPRPLLPQGQEVPQNGPKAVTLWGTGEPRLLIGYKRPPENDRDDAALDAVATILGDRQTGWLQKELIEDQQIARNVEAISDYPAGRFINLFVLTATPARDHTVEESRKAIEEAVVRLQSRPVDAETLARTRNVLRGRFLRLLGSNQELASMLPSFYANYGDWRKLFALGGAYEHLTAEDIQRVASTYLIPAGETVATFTSMPAPANASNSGGQQ
jgi:predicted Zn-dependent peptidase